MILFNCSIFWSFFPFIADQSLDFISRFGTHVPLFKQHTCIYGIILCLVAKIG